MVLAQQLLLALFGIGSWGWGFFDPRFRDAEGSFIGEFCLPMALGLALLTLAWTRSGHLKRSGFWFALALFGQAVALQMIEAGPLTRYQHYKPFNRLFVETHPLLLIFVLLQTVLVVAGVRGHWPSIWAWLRNNFKGWQLSAISLIFVFSSATVSRDIGVYLCEVPFAAFLQIINLATIVLMVWALPDNILSPLERMFDRLFGSREELKNSHTVEPVVILAAIWVGLLSAGLSWYVYESHPHIQDEVIYLYHARYLAEGLLTVPAPPIPAAFSFYMIPYEADRWFSIFPPGWPAMLALGVFLGAPWLVNPILAAVNVLLSYGLLREVYPRRTAVLAVILLSLSPWFVFMGMNLMAHTFTLTCALGAALAVVWASKTGKFTWGLIGGSGVGMVSLIRPLDGVVTAGLLGLWAFIASHQRLKVLTSFALGTVTIAAVVLPYNRHITGSSTVFPLTAYYEKYYGPKANAFGFGPGRGLNWPIDAFPGHSPIEALINANLNTFSINIELFGWSTGSLILSGLFLFSGTSQKGDYSMLAVILAIVGVFSLYWFSGGPDFGARYWYLTVVSLVALSARGINFLETTFQRVIGGSTSQSTRVIVAVLSLSSLALVNFFPWRAIDKYHHYLGMRPNIRYLAKEYSFGKSLVLVRGNEHPDYTSAFIYNPVDFTGDVPIYAWDRSPEVRRKLLAAYPDRPVWIIDGPSITGDGYKVIAGPLTTEHALLEEQPSL